METRINVLEKGQKAIKKYLSNSENTVIVRF